jgi:hypothetical protein
VRKEDIIRLHALLFQLRCAMEGLTDAGDAFAAYDKLGILPTHIQQGKGAHQRAVFVLGEALSKVAVASSADPKLKHVLRFVPAPPARLG